MTDRLLLDKRDRVWHRSEEHTSELQSQSNLVCRLLHQKKNRHGTRHRRSPDPSPTRQLILTATLDLTSPFPFQSYLPIPASPYLLALQLCHIFAYSRTI